MARSKDWLRISPDFSHISWAKGTVACSRSDHRSIFEAYCSVVRYEQFHGERGNRARLDET